MIYKDFEVAKIFNELYINIVEKFCCKPFEILGCPKNPEQDRETIKHIVKHFKEYPSIKEIKKYYFTKEPIFFHLQKLLE